MNVSDEIRAIADTFLEKVRKSGPENVMALCPFHMKADGSQERHPSFAMSLTNGLWFCHACQARGNLFTFLRDMGLPHNQITLRYSPLVEAASKNMPPRMDPLRPTVFSNNPIEEGLLGIFDYCPIDLLNAGFHEQTLHHFEVGFDTSHMRITFPLRDLGGKLVGVSGRCVDSSWPKYKIYDTEYKLWGLPERLNWDKRTVLWNAHQVYSKVYFETNPTGVVVVEGFKACMWVWQSGIKDVVALNGTYLSREQRWILERMGAPVYLFLDNNDAGQAGIAKFGEQMRRTLPLFIVEYPERLIDDEDAQPDSLTSEETVQQVTTARSYFDWLAA